MISKTKELNNSISKQKRMLLACLVIIIIAFRVATACYMTDIYPDEERSLLQISSMIETGCSTEGEHWPLYIKNGHGLTTYAFLYPLIPFAALFGSAKQTLRVILQLFTVAACFLLSKGVEIWSNEKSMYYNTLVCSLTLPWGLIQANRIWDPALVPFYFAMYFYLFSIVYNEKIKRKSFSCIILACSMISLVMLAVVYPPCRIPAVALWIISIALLWKDKKLSVHTLIAVIIVSAIASMPLAYSMLFVEGFNSRASALIVFDGGNPVVDIYSWARNFAEEFNPRVLFVTGDEVSRHSLPVFGVLGTSAIIPLLYQIRRKMNKTQLIMWFSIIFSTASVACTNEYHPHTLRNCLCWPAYAILMAYGWKYFAEKSKSRKIASFAVISIQFLLVFIACILFYNGRLKSLSVN